MALHLTKVTKVSQFLLLVTEVSLISGLTVSPSSIARVLYGENLRINCTLNPDWTGMAWNDGVGWVLTSSKVTCGNNKTSIGFYVSCHGDTVQLHKVNPEEGKRYKCQQVAGSTIQAESGFTRVEIYADGPLLTTNADTIKVKETDDLVLTCKARGGPNITLGWTHQNKSLLPFTSKTGENQISLRLPAVTRNQTGDYKCNGAFTFRNVEFKNVKSVYIDVQYPPVLTMKEVSSVISGHNVTLTCEARGNPMLVAFRPWKHYVGHTLIRELNGTKDPNDSKSNHLYLNDVGVKDTGNYMCTADNGIPDAKGRPEQESSVTLNAEYPPTLLSQLNKVYYVENNTTFEISFYHVSNPPITSQFIINDLNDTLVNDDRVSIIHEKTAEHDTTVYGVQVQKDAYKTKLMFDPIMGTDSGIYDLISENNHSYTDNTFQIYVLDKPYVPENIQFEADENSITVQWQYNLPVDPLHNFMIHCKFPHDSCQNGELRYSDISDQSVHSYKLTNLTQYTKYILNICSCNPLGKSCSTTFAVATKDNNLYAAPSMQSQKLQNNKIVFSSIGACATLVVILIIMAAYKLAHRNRFAGHKLGDRGSTTSLSVEYRAEHNSYVATTNNARRIPGVDRDTYLTPKSSDRRKDIQQENVYDVIPVDKTSMIKLKKETTKGKRKERVFSKKSTNVRAPSIVITTTSPGTEYNSIILPFPTESVDDGGSAKPVGSVTYLTPTGAKVSAEGNVYLKMNLQKETCKDTPIIRVEDMKEQMLTPEMAKKLEESGGPGGYISMRNETCKDVPMIRVEDSKEQTLTPQMARKLEESGYIAMRNASVKRKSQLNDNSQTVQQVHDNKEADSKFDAYKY